MDLLRFTTAGSVDDGKSTLIGRLLYDSQAVYEDQLHSVRKATRNQATKGLDLSLLTDGLRAEREQGITIDVAYRYFSTARRKFIIADTPGHEQYTRNMATGASTADLAVILIDARYGVLPQSRRHAYIARLLGIPHLVAAVNKMDLVGFDEGVFDEIRRDFGAFVASMAGPTASIQYIPMSALDGDNVVRRSARAPWYKGPGLLEHLETVRISDARPHAPFRFPVQYVIRPDLHFRGFAGQIASGMVRKGDQVIVVPSGRATSVKSIVTFDGELEEAFAPMSVTLQLADETDISRGDTIVHAWQPPSVGRIFQASLVWMDDRRLHVGRPYLLKHGAQTTQARVAGIVHRVDIQTLSPEPASALGLNEIARVRIEAHRPIAFDAYTDVRSTGAFILIDPVTNATVGAGMIERGEAEEGRCAVTESERRQRQGHGAFLVLLPEGCREEAAQLERMLFEDGATVRAVDLAAARPAVVSALLWAGIGVVAFGENADDLQPDGAAPVVRFDRKPGLKELEGLREKIWKEAGNGRS